MPINFPNSPTPNQLYTYDNKTWEWNGVYWEVYSALTSYITSAYTVGDGVSAISGVSGGNIALKSFSGDNITIIDSGDKLTFKTSTIYSAGAVSGATWSSTGSGGINLPQIEVALFDNPNNIAPIYTYIVPSGTTGVGGIPALTNNDTNYIVIDYNGGTPVYDVLLSDTTINDSSIVLFLIVYRADNFVHVLEFGNQGAGLPNKINDRIIMTERFARESGFSLGLSGSTGVVTLSAGVSWNGVYRQSLIAINSFDDIFFQSFHSGGTFVYTTTANTLNNLYYDNGTNPVLSSPGKFLVNWYFRGQEINDHIYELWGTADYDTLSEAQLATEPTQPELISSHAFLVGRIIVQYSATTGSVESAFITYFQGSEVQAHNDLTGIQGGTAGQYFHLNSNEYNNLPLLNTNNIFQSGITANTISATTYQNLPIDVFVTGASYNNANTLTFTNNTGGTFTVDFNTVTGWTVNGNLNATTISATTYQNLPTDVFVTGSTYNNANTLTFTNNTGGTFDVSFNIFTGITANTISATTYQNLPTDVFVTGGTVSSGTTTFTNNTGGTFNVSGFYYINYTAENVANKNTGSTMNLNSTTSYPSDATVADFTMSRIIAHKICTIN